MDLMLLLGLLAMGGTLYAVHFWNTRHAHPDWQRLPTPTGNACPLAPII